MVQRYDKLVRCFQIIAIPAIIFFLSFLTVFFGSSVYTGNIRHERGMELTTAFLDYVFSANDAVNFEGLNERETSHLKDVKYVLQGYFIFSIAVLFLFLLSVIAAKPKSHIFFYGGLATIALCILIGAVPFELIFDKFHGLVFAPESWKFPWDELLVSVYTFDFFYAFFKRIVVQTAVGGVIVFICSKIEIIFSILHDRNL